MTESERSATSVHVVVEDVGRVYRGVPLTPTEQAAAARRWGWSLFGEHMLRQMRAYLVSVLFYDIGQLVLYLIAMGLALGGLVDARTDGIDGVSYLTFVAPAIVVGNAVMTASGELTYTVMQGFKWQRWYHGPAASPVSGAQIALGHQAAVLVRYLAQSVIALGVLWAFGALHSASAWLLVPIAALTGLAFGAPLQAYSATLKDEGYQFALVQRFIVMPLFLFSGTFFPLDAMPGYLHWIGWISPIWHGAELSRLATYGHAVSPSMVAVHLAYLLGLAVLGLVLASRTYARRLTS